MCKKVLLKIKNKISIFLLAILFYQLLNFGLTQFTFFMYEVNFVNFPFNFLSVFVAIIILISLSMFTKINTKNKISSKKQKIKYINEKNYKHKIYINFPVFNKNYKYIFNYCNNCILIKNYACYNVIAIIFS